MSVNGFEGVRPPTPVPPARAAVGTDPNPVGNPAVAGDDGASVAGDQGAYQALRFEGPETLDELKMDEPPTVGEMASDLGISEAELEAAAQRTGLTPEQIYAVMTGQVEAMSGAELADLAARVGLEPDQLAQLAAANGASMSQLLEPLVLISNASAQVKSYNAGEPVRYTVADAFRDVGGRCGGNDGAFYGVATDTVIMITQMMIQNGLGGGDTPASLLSTFV